MCRTRNNSRVLLYEYALQYLGGIDLQSYFIKKNVVLMTSFMTHGKSRLFCQIPTHPFKRFRVLSNHRALEGELQFEVTIFRKCQCPIDIFQQLQYRCRFSFNSVDVRIKCECRILMPVPPISNRPVSGLANRYTPTTDTRFIARYFLVHQR